VTLSSENLFCIAAMGGTGSKSEMVQATFTSTPHLEMATYRKQTKDGLQDLIKDTQFQGQISERAFQICLHEDLPDYWPLQLKLLLAIKFIFDGIRPKGATVVFPNLPMRYPGRETEVLLNLTNIQNVYEGMQIWIEHLVREGTVQTGDSGWQGAFQRTPQGYQITRIQVEDNASCNGIRVPATLLRQSVSNIRRKASEEMTRTIESVYNKCQLAQEASNEALKDTISQKARDLLPRYMEPVPLDFAIRNYENLMATSYRAGTRIGSSNVAFQAIVDAKETFASGFGLNVKIVIVKGTVPHAHVNILLNAKTEAQKYLHEESNGGKLRKVGSYGVCFAGLPGTGSNDAWRRLTNHGNRDKSFCEYLDIPIDISGNFVRKLLLGAVV
jgi:hypothetical protein